MTFLDLLAWDYLIRAFCLGLFIGIFGGLFAAYLFVKYKMNHSD